MEQSAQSCGSTFLSPASSFATSYVKEFSDRYHLEKGVFEGWHYPGLTVLLAISAYLIARLRGTHLPVSDPRLLDRLMGLSALLVLLSLAGGPSFFMVSGLGCFRAYGRAGLLALPLWCVAAPLVLQAILRAPRLARLRPAFCLAILGIALYEGHGATAWFPTGQPIETPQWVEWLARQPAGVRLAAFPPARDARGGRVGLRLALLPAQAPPSDAQRSGLAALGVGSQTPGRIV